MKKDTKRSKMFLAAMLGKAMIIAVLALGMVLTGCEEDDGGGGGVPDELVAKWYSDAATTIEVFEITSDSIIISSTTYDIKVDGTTIQNGLQGTYADFITDYKVDGKTLTGKIYGGTSITYYKK